MIDACSVSDEFFLVRHSVVSCVLYRCFCWKFNLSLAQDRINADVDPLPAELDLVFMFITLHVFFSSFQKRNPEVRHVDLEILWCHTLHVISRGVLEWMGNWTGASKIVRHFRVPRLKRCFYHKTIAFFYDPHNCGQSCMLCRLNYNVDSMRTLLIFLKQLYSKVNDQMLIMYVGFWQFRTVHRPKWLVQKVLTRLSCLRWSYITTCRDHF